MRLFASHSPLLVQLVPPMSGGVRDFAECLKHEWALGGQPSQLIELDGSSDHWTPLYVRLLARLESSQQGCAIVLHFSGYGYDPRGLCGWLVNELQEARRRIGPQLHVVAMFHELFAGGPPWRSAFWLGALQARVARQLAQSCDGIWTNSQHHAAWLSACLPVSTPLIVRPVFSTIGEPVSVSPAHDRARGLVVFGSPSTRQRAFARLAAHEPELVALGVEEVIEAGSGLRSTFEARRLPHRCLGPLAPAQLCELLQAHRFALIDYPSIHLGKSTVFAAYAVNGCSVLNTAAPGPDADSLQHGRHYACLGQGAFHGALDAASAMAVEARTWYGRHRLPTQAREFLELLEPRPRVGLPGGAIFAAQERAALG